MNPKGMNNEDLQEMILATLLETESTINSRYGLYDYPPMFDLFVEDGVTTAIRGGITQERVNFNYVEVPGVKWGRHVDGQWDRDYQERSATFKYFIEETLRPALERGATFCHDFQSGMSPSP